MIENARYVYGPDREKASILAVIDGEEKSIPLAAENSDYAILMASGVTIDDPGPPPEPVPTFVARELIDLLTAADLGAIETAIAGNADLRLLWLRMTGRGDKPISTGSPDFAAGWAGLTQALGTARAAEIAAALGIA